MKEILKGLLAIIISLGLVRFLLTGMGPGLSEFSVKLPGVYELRSAAGTKVSPVFEYRDNPKIPPEVSRLGYNRDFILAERNPRVYSPTSGSPGHYFIDTQTSDFWILVLKDNTLLGPLDRGAFEKAKIELGIGERIALKTVCQYRDWIDRYYLYPCEIE